MHVQPRRVAPMVGNADIALTPRGAENVPHEPWERRTGMARWREVRKAHDRREWRSQLAQEYDDL